MVQFTYSTFLVKKLIKNNFFVQNLKKYWIPLWTERQLKYVRIGLVCFDDFIILIKF